MEPVKSFSDTELLANIRSGFAMNESVKAIYHNHFDGLCRYVMNNSGSRQDAEDVFQEVVVSFIELVQNNRFRGDSTLKTFLYSVNRHIWLNELKRRGRSFAREKRYGTHQLKEEVDVSYLMAEREAKEKLIQLVAGLGDI